MSISIDDCYVYVYQFMYFYIIRIVATATGKLSGMNNRVGGRCSSARKHEYKMRLIIKVCPYGEAGTASCPICMTAACYNHGRFLLC